MVIPIYADLDQFVGLSEQIEVICLQRGMDESQAALFRLTLVELGTNVLRHGLRYGDEASMWVYLLRREQSLITVFSDGGKEVPMAAFQHSAVLVSNLGDIPVEDLPEGGFGLTIITTASSRYRYLRKENINYHMLLWDTETSQAELVNL